MALVLRVLTWCETQDWDFTQNSLQRVLSPYAHHRKPPAETIAAEPGGAEFVIHQPTSLPSPLMETPDYSPKTDRCINLLNGPSVGHRGDPAEDSLLENVANRSFQ